MSGNLLKTQMNEVFEIIKSFELNPLEFNWGEDDSHNISRKISFLVHKPTQYFFVFDYVQQSAFEGIYRLSKYSPGDSEIVTCPQ